MSLSIALGAALSGLKVNQESLAVLANNVANANNENYIRRTVKQSSVTIAGVGQGASIDQIMRSVDTFLMDEIRTQQSVLSNLEIMDKFHQQIQIYFGNPDNGSSISATIEEFFNSLKSLSNNPELSAQRLNAVKKGADLASKISGLATKLEELRLEADREIYTTVNRINSLISSINDLNIAISKGKNSSQPTIGFEEERDNLLKDLAKEIDITVLYTSKGQAFIQSGKGISLLDTSLRELVYTQASSLNVFINDDASYLNAIEVKTLNSNGTEIGSRQELVSSGRRGEIESQIRGGNLNGLIEIRDNIITDMIDHLDNVAYEFVERFNALHNTGSGYPPRNSIIGTTEVTQSSYTSFEGKVRIGLVDESGNPLLSAYSDEPNLKPLTLDLSTLDSGYGAGKPTINTIIKEINYFYEPPQKRISLGDLSDVRMVSKNNGISDPNGTFTFDFEVENKAATNTTFKVTGISVDNGAAGLSSALPSDTIVLPGERKRTANSATVSFTGGSGSPYTVSVDIEALGADGISYTDTIDFLITTGVTGILNTRYIATNLTTSGDAEIILPTSNSRYLTASLVDSDGNTISANSATSGFLKLESADSSYKIVIDDLTSQETGLSTSTQTIAATNRGFSHYYGLNNFFTIEADELKRSAYNMAVREDLLTSPNLISMGAYRQSPQSSDETADPVYTYEITIGGNEVIQQLANLSVTTVSFSAAGLLPSSASTFNQYIGDLIASASILSSNNKIILIQENDFQNAFIEKERNGGGVSLDEELANSIVYQNAYAASAKIIAVTKELFDVLFNSI